MSEIDGKILQRTQDGKITKSLVVNGELIATTGPGIGEDDFSPSFRPIDGGNPSASPGTYRVQPGDTLQSIAQQAFGDSRLWYSIAEANSLSGDRDLRVGQTLTVPNRVSGNYNDYQSFKPYDAGKIIGDTQPTMPMPSAKGGGCGGIGQILVIAVAVVATVYTAGTLAPLVASSSAAAAGAGVAAGATAGTSFAATMTAGVGALSGSLGFASVGVGLAAGAAGSIVSQGVGMAIGVQGKMNWSAVARSSLASGVSAGIGAGARVLAGSSSASLQTAGQAIGGSASGASVNTGQLIARAALTSSVTQGVSLAVGLQSKFSWAAVAGAAVGAGVGNVVADKLRDSAFQYEMVRGFVSSAAAGTTAAVLSGGRADYVQVAVDAFGNALGNSVVEQSIKPGDAERQAREASATRREIKDQGPNYFASQLIKSGVDAETAWQAANSSALTDFRQINDAIVSAEDAAGQYFDHMAVDAKVDALWDATTRAPTSLSNLVASSGSGELKETLGLSGQLSAGDQIYLGTLPPTSVFGSSFSDPFGSFVMVAADVINTTNAAVASLVDAVGPTAATAAVVGIQLSVGGVPRTLISMAADNLIAEPKAGITRSLSGVIADKAFGVDGSLQSGYATNARQVSDTLAGFGVDLALSSASGVVQSAVSSRAVLNVASDGIANQVKGPYRGGPHREMQLPRWDGLDSHHIPDRNADPRVSVSAGPAIQMEKHDHRETSSHGTKGDKGYDYRAETAELIGHGLYREAIAREILDVRRASFKASGSRSKYNEALREMLDYSRLSNQLPINLRTGK